MKPFVFFLFTFLTATAFAGDFYIVSPTDQGRDGGYVWSKKCNGGRGGYCQLD